MSARVEWICAGARGERFVSTCTTEDVAVTSVPLCCKIMRTAAERRYLSVYTSSQIYIYRCTCIRTSIHVL